MVTLLCDLALQLVFTVGIIFAFGFVIALCNKRFYRNFGSRSRIVCYVTGFFGTPVHELSHALLCVIFAHRITEIKLFQINSADGTLGYVRHSYNRKNIYQSIGNFFIGIAPIIVITVILYVVAYFLLPDFTAAVFTSAASGETSAAELFDNILNIITAFFSCIASWQWWVFLLVGLLLSIHMTLSKEDVKGAASGLIILIIILFLVDLVLMLINDSLLYTFTHAVMSAGCGMLCFFVISLITSLLAVGLSYIYRFIFLRN